MHLRVEIREPKAIAVGKCAIDADAAHAALWIRDRKISGDVQVRLRRAVEADHARKDGCLGNVRHLLPDEIEAQRIEANVEVMQPQLVAHVDASGGRHAAPSGACVTQREIGAELHQPADRSVEPRLAYDYSADR